MDGQTGLDRPHDYHGAPCRDATQLQCRRTATEKQRAREEAADLRHTVKVADLRHIVKVRVAYMRHTSKVSDLRQTINVTDLKHTIKVSDLRHTINVTDLKHTIKVSDLKHRSKVLEISLSAQSFHLHHDKYPFPCNKSHTTTLYGQSAQHVHKGSTVQFLPACHCTGSSNVLPCGTFGRFPQQIKRDVVENVRVNVQRNRS